MAVRRDRLGEDRRRRCRRCRRRTTSPSLFTSSDVCAGRRHADAIAVARNRREIHDRDDEILAVAARGG